MAISAYERTVRRFHRSFLGQEEATRRALARAYRDAAREIARQIERLSRENAQSLRLARLRTLERQIDDELTRLVSQSVRLIEQGQRTMVQLGPDQVAGQVAAQAPFLESSFTRLPRLAFETMVGSLADGTPLRSVLMRYGVVADREAQRILANAIALGINPRATARQLREVLGVWQWEAERIARTEQIRVFRESARFTLQQNQDIVRGYRRLATHDARTCPVCLALDGKFHQLDEAMESHPQCRCVGIPVLHRRFGAELMLETGSDWFARQNATTRRAILGPGKAALFNASALRLIDLVDRFDDPTWGPQIREVPLKALRGSARRAA